MNDSTQDKIDKIVIGEIDIETNELTEKEKDLLKDTTEIKEALRLHDLMQKKSIIDKLESNYTINEKSITQSSRFKLMRGLAAVCLLLIGATFVFNTFSKGFNPDEYIIHQTLRSTDNSQLSNDKKKAYNLFILGEYDRAIPRLEKLSTNTTDTISQYYLALSYYGVGQKGKYLSAISDPRVNHLKKPE